MSVDSDPGDAARTGPPKEELRGAREELRRKLEAMAGQAESPAEAEIARRKLRDLERELGPDLRSFTERYRATPYESRRSPEPVVAVARPRVGGATRLLYWLGILILAGAVLGAVGLAVVLLNQHVPVVALATPPPPTPRPSPTPTPGLPDDQAVLDRFVRFLAPGRRAFHVDVESTVAGSGRDATIAVSGSVSGFRWSASVSTTPLHGAAKSGRLVMVDGRWWYRLGSAAWKEGYLPLADVPDVDPFALISGVGDLVYLGPEQRGGTWTQHLATRQGWVSYSTQVNGANPNLQLDSARMDIWVTAGGVPIEAVYEAETGSVATVARETFTTHVEYSFSRVGQKVTIDPP